MGYKKQVIKGIGWLGGFRAAARGITFLRTAILARLLTPAEFGFFAVASLVLSLTELITETGINIVLIQKKDSIDKYINTAWITSILRGFVIGIIIICLAPVVSYFFEMEQVFSLVLLIALVPVIRGFINPSKVKLVKDLRYKEEFVYNLFQFSIEFLVTIIAAYFTRSASSIIYGLIAGAMYDVVASYVVFRPLPQPIFKKNLFMDVIHSGKWLTLVGVLSYLYQNIDNIIIGRLLGASSLGLYDVTYKISLLPLTEVTDVVGKAAFPVMVKINEDLPRLKKAYIQSVLAIFLFSACVALVLFLFPTQVVKIVLGDQWISAVPLLQVLCVLGVLRAIFVSAVYPLYALHKQKVATFLTFVSFSILLIIIIPFVSMWGVMGAAYATIIGTLIPLPLAFYLVFKEFKIKAS